MKARIIYSGAISLWMFVCPQGRCGLSQYGLPDFKPVGWHPSDGGGRSGGNSSGDEAALARARAERMAENSRIINERIRKSKELHDKGVRLMNDHQYAKAEKYLRQAIATYNCVPRIDGWAIDLCSVLLQEGKYAEAEAESRADLEENNLSIRARLSLAVALHDQGRLEEAEAKYLEVLNYERRTWPDHFDPNYYNAPPEPDGLRPARLTTEPFPDTVDSLLRQDLGILFFQRAYAQLEQGNSSQAEATYRQSIRLYPANAAAHNNRAVALVKQGRLAEAVDEFSEALRLDPSKPDHKKNLALTIVDQAKDASEKKNDIEAESELSRLIGLCDTFSLDPSTRENLVRIQEAKRAEAATARRKVEHLADALSGAPSVANLGFGGDAGAVDARNAGPKPSVVGVSAAEFRPAAAAPRKSVDVPAPATGAPAPQDRQLDLSKVIKNPRILAGVHILQRMGRDVFLGKLRSILKEFDQNASEHELALRTGMAEQKLSKEVLDQIGKINYENPTEDELRKLEELPNATVLELFRRICREPSLRTDKDAQDFRILFGEASPTQ